MIPRLDPLLNLEQICSGRMTFAFIWSTGTNSHRSKIYELCARHMGISEGKTEPAENTMGPRGTSFMKVRV